jgi:hypothetical protein
MMLNDKDVRVLTFVQQRDLELAANVRRVRENVKAFQKLLRIAIEKKVAVPMRVTSPPVEGEMDLLEGSSNRSNSFNGFNYSNSSNSFNYSNSSNSFNNCSNSSNSYSDSSNEYSDSSGNSNNWSNHSNNSNNSDSSSNFNSNKLSGARTREEVVLFCRLSPAPNSDETKRKLTAQYFAPVLWAMYRKSTPKCYEGYSVRNKCPAFRHLLLRFVV